MWRWKGYWVFPGHLVACMDLYHQRYIRHEVLAVAAAVLATRAGGSRITAAANATATTESERRAGIPLGDGTIQLP